MSEVTYKKIVDVEQIDTLGEDTTLFVNDGGSMKQMDAAVLGAVKSVNGVTPDENGDVEVNAAEKIAFVYMPEMGDLLCEKTAAEIHELYSNVTTAHGLCFILRVYDFTNPMAPTPDYLYNKIEVESIQNGGTYYKLIYHIHFGDVVPPVLVDAINNTITLDPDWVAPEAPLTEEDVNTLIDSKLEGAGSSDGVILVGQYDENDNYVYPDETMIAALTALQQGKFVAYKDDSDQTWKMPILSWRMSTQSPDGYRYLNFYYCNSEGTIEKVQIAVNPSIVPDGM